MVAPCDMVAHSDVVASLRPDHWPLVIWWPVLVWWRLYALTVVNGVNGFVFTDYDVCLFVC